MSTSVESPISTRSLNLVSVDLAAIKARRAACVGCSRGGTIALDQSPLGGLRAQLTLPRA